METVRAFLRILDFAAEYELVKCLKTMMIGMLCICVIMVLRKLCSWNDRYGNAGRKLYIMLLLLPTAFTGMSRFFFMRGTVRINSFLYENVKPIYGKIYFAVCAVMVVRFLWKHLYMRRKFGWYKTEIYEETFEETLEDAIDCVTASDRLPFRKLYLSHVRLYVTDRDISPFSGGIFRPYVVMPEKILCEWDIERRRLVMCHELIHICSGHVIMLTLFRLLEIYWWINPLIYVCTSLIMDDMELVCDEQCLACTSVSPAGYGRVMLDMLGIMRHPEPEGTPAFMRGDGFEEMKKRLENLRQAGNAGGSHEILRINRKQGCEFAVAAFLLAVAVMLTSYPRYTIMKELVLYDEKLNVIDYDSDALRAAAQVRDGRIIIDEERFAEFIAGMEVEGDYVYLSFGTIMKQPGCGGGGNVGMIALDDYGDIFYLSADCIENRVAEFCLKYLL